MIEQRDHETVGWPPTWNELAGRLLAPGYVVSAFLNVRAYVSFVSNEPGSADKRCAQGSDGIHHSGSERQTCTNIRSCGRWSFPARCYRSNSNHGLPSFMAVGRSLAGSRYRRLGDRMVRLRPSADDSPLPDARIPAEWARHISRLRSTLCLHLPRRRFRLSRSIWTKPPCTRRSPENPGPAASGCRRDDRLGRCRTDHRNPVCRIARYPGPRQGVGSLPDGELVRSPCDLRHRFRYAPYPCRRTDEDVARPGRRRRGALCSRKRSGRRLCTLPSPDWNEAEGHPPAERGRR